MIGLNGKVVDIVLIEDDDIDARGIIRAFRKAKIANPIHRAVDGIDAFSILKGQNGVKEISDTYILLVDLNMPRMNGIEFLQELRQDNELKSSIAFVLTTSQLDEDKVAAYDLNVAGYIVKQNAGNDFVKLVDLIGSYWRVVEIP